MRSTIVPTHTLIEWCTRVWNSVLGCKRKSVGCANCYIPTTMPFRTRGIRFDGPHVGASTGDLVLLPHRLLLPLTWTQPERIFVNSLSDVFNEDLPIDFVVRKFAVMSLARLHTFVLLTKRADQMQAIVSNPEFRAAVFAARDELLKVRQVQTAISRGRAVVDDQWPLPNLHLGVSVENQAAANDRIPKLLKTPAAVHCLSIEPLIRRVDLRRVRDRDRPEREHHVIDALAGHVIDTRRPDQLHEVLPNRVTWIIIGGESGKGARPMDMAWVPPLIEHAREAGTAAFFKQLGSDLRKRLGLRHPKGGDPAEWPEPFPRELPGPEHGALPHPAPATSGATS